jgi:hypothetical protein
MSDHHWYDNDSTLGLGLGMVMLARRHAQQQAAEAPYKRAEFAAWWAGLTPEQQDAYNLSMAQSQAINVPQRRPKTLAEKRGLAKVVIYMLAFLLSTQPLAYALPNDMAGTPGNPLWLLVIPVIFVVATLLYWFFDGWIEASARRSTY